jgi:hypothetical protein
MSENPDATPEIITAGDVLSPEACIFCHQITVERGHLEELAYRGAKIQHDFPAHTVCLEKAHKQANMWKIPAYVVDFLGLAYVLLSFFAETSILTIIVVVVYLVVSFVLHRQVDTPMRMVKKWEKNKIQPSNG